MTSPVPNESYVKSNGSASNAVFIEIFLPRSPTPYDNIYLKQQRWFNTATAEEYILTGFTSFNGVNQAVWQNIVSTLEIVTPSGGPVDPNSMGQIKFTSSAGTVAITGNKGTNTVNFDITGGSDAIETLTGDDSVVVVPLAGNVNLTSSVVSSSTYPIRVISPSANTEQIQIQYSAAIASTNASNVGVSAFNSSDFTVDATGFVSLIGSNAAIETITGNDNVIVVPTSGNVNLLGVGATTTSGSGSTASIFSPNTAKIIVDPTANYGNYQTISEAITAASSGQTIFIRPGTYPENLTLKAGVNLTAFTGDADIPNVTIKGNATFTADGYTCISNILLQTNSNFLLSVTGANASNVILNNCYLNCTNNTGISYTTSNTLSNIYLNNCDGDLGTTGISYLNMTSTGVFNFDNCLLGNSGGSTTATTSSAGNIYYRYTVISSPVSSTGTAIHHSQYSFVDCSLLNVIALTFNGSVGGESLNSIYYSGSAAAISVGAAATLPLVNAIIFSNVSSTNALIGSGALNYANIIFLGSATNNTVTTSTAYTKLG